MTCTSTTTTRPERSVACSAAGAMSHSAAPAMTQSCFGTSPPTLRIRPFRNVPRRMRRPNSALEERKKTMAQLKAKTTITYDNGDGTGPHTAEPGETFELDDKKYPGSYKHLLDSGDAVKAGTREAVVRPTSAATT